MENERFQPPLASVRVRADAICTELKTDVSYQIRNAIIVGIAPDIYQVLSTARDQLGTNPLVQVKPQDGETLLVSVDDLELLELKE